MRSWAPANTTARRRIHREPRKEGHGDPHGLDHWIYYDPVDREFKWGAPEPHPFLRPAYEKNRSRWNGIIENELREAKG